MCASAIANAHSISKGEPCRGVTDVGQGLHAIAAALSDPETISAYQTERGGKQYSRTFYHGMHEVSGGLNNAGDSVAQLAEVPVCQVYWAFHGNLSDLLADYLCAGCSSLR